MSHHSHPKHDSHKHAHPHPPSRSGSGGVKPHVKWGMLVAIALMLIAMAIYVFTNDESNVPGEQLQPEVPVGP
jgi:hypothetical protein